MENRGFPLILLFLLDLFSDGAEGGFISMVDSDDDTSISVGGGFDPFGSPKGDHDGYPYGNQNGDAGGYPYGGQSSFSFIDAGDDQSEGYEGGSYGENFNSVYGGNPYVENPYGGGSYGGNSYEANPYGGKPTYGGQFGADQSYGSPSSYGYGAGGFGGDNQMDHYGGGYLPSGYPSIDQSMDGQDRNVGPESPYGDISGGDGDSFPPIACPAIFKYMYDPKYGGYFGYISIPRPHGEIKYDTEINMTINRPVSQQDNIKLQLMSTANDIYYGNTLNWAAKFPYQDMLPKLTQIKFNGVVICSSYPDPLIPGVTQSSMWAKSSISSGKKERDSEDGESRKKKRKRKRRKKKRNMKGRRKVPIGKPASAYTPSFNPYPMPPNQINPYSVLPGGPIDATGGRLPYEPQGYKR